MRIKMKCAPVKGMDISAAIALRNAAFMWSVWMKWTAPGIDVVREKTKTDFNMQSRLKSVLSKMGTILKIG